MFFSEPWKPPLKYHFTVKSCFYWKTKCVKKMTLIILFLPQISTKKCFPVGCIQTNELITMQANTNEQNICTKYIKYVHVDTRVDGSLVHHHIKLSLDVFQRAVVSEAAPLCVNAHTPVHALHTFHVLHLLHVAGVGSRTCRGRQCEDSRI